MRALVVVGVAMMFGGCAADVGEGKPAAVVAEAPANPEPAAPAAGETKLAIDVSRSKLGAVGAKVTAQHPVDFHDFSGEVVLDGQRVRGVSFVAQVASLESDHPKLTAHLVKEDFLFAEQYPTATFTSTEIKDGSETAGMTHTVSGELSIRGKTKQVTFPAKIDVSAEQVEATTEFTINRQDFGVTYPGKKDDLVQDNVLMKIAFVAPRR